MVCQEGYTSSLAAASLQDSRHPSSNRRDRRLRRLARAALSAKPVFTGARGVRIPPLTAKTHALSGSRTYVSHQKCKYEDM